MMAAETTGDNRDDDVQLLEFWASPYVMRAQVALAAKGIAYTSVPQELGPNNKSPLLLQSNPVHKKVPVLLHNGKPISESLIIVQYLDEAFPSPDGRKDLLPKDPYHKAMARFWADFCDKKLLEAVLKVIRTPREEISAAIEESKGYLSTLEGAFAAASTEELPYFAGSSQVGFVDVVLAPLVVVLPALESVAGFEWDFEKLPRFQAWLKAFGASPAAACLPSQAKLAEVAKSLRKRRFPNEYE